MPAVAVCGFPRCGSSMLMRMLHMGGIEPVGNVTSYRSYETAHQDSFLTMDPAELAGHSIKLLDAVKWRTDTAWPDVEWRIVWADRNTKQQAKSNRKLLGLAGDGAHYDPMSTSAWRASLEADRPAVLHRLKQRGRVLGTKYEHTLRSPLATASLLAAFLPEFGLDIEAMAAVVHLRQPECAPDLHFEHTGECDPALLVKETR